MPCLAPITVKSKQKEKMSVPCGYCHDCRAKKRREWAFRVYAESKYSYSAKFITLTYDDDNIPLVTNDGEFLKGIPAAIEAGAQSITPSLYKKDVQDFIKRLRDRQHQYLKKIPEQLTLWENEKISFPKIRYLIVGEYGSKTHRPHYHAIMFNVLPDILDKVRQIWKHGSVDIGELTNASANYVTKYVLKSVQERKEYVTPEFKLQSDNLGLKYITRNRKYHYENRNLLVRGAHGNLQSMPAKWRKKVFEWTDEKGNTHFDRVSYEVALKQMLRVLDEQQFKKEQEIEENHPDPDQYFLDLWKQKIGKVNKQLLTTSQRSL